MDISEYTRIVFEKLQRFEHEHATKIIGYLLLQDHGEQEIVKLASCPDHIIHEVALKARTELQRLAAKSAILPISLPINSQKDISHLSIISPNTTLTSIISPNTTPTSPASFPAPSPYWESQSTSNTNNSEFMAYFDSISELQKQTQLFSLDNHLDTAKSGIASDYYGLDVTAGNLGGKSTRRFSNTSEFPVKICHYFNRGYCKNGNSCRFYHGQVVPEIFSQMCRNEAANEDQAISPGSLAQLESEIVELLKPKRGSPMSIASLPLAYYDKYKKVLQAEGYLTESQRHGKSGYSLTKLLERLKNSIRLIGRPHGQHAVVLAEDAPKYLGKADFGQNISASRQIYLTFPADSTFSEDDVSNYFSTFGCVEDVRIPCQQRRMFGFVTFDDPENVKMILDKGNPHFVRGSRVLVKPYKEKPKLTERKYSDRMEHSPFYPPHYADIETEPTTIPRSCGNHRFLRRLLIEEQDQALELHQRRLARLQLTQKPLSSSPHLGFNMDELKLSDDHFNIQPSESFSYSLDDNAECTAAKFTDEDNNSEILNLPDSPFSFPVDSGISAVI